MPKIVFQPEGHTCEYALGELPYQDHGLEGSLLDVAMNFHIPVEHACGGSCACTTCHVVIEQGMELLSEAEDDELDRVDTAAGVTLKSRLACQAVVVKEGTVVARIPNWNRNYVSEGGGSMNLGDAIPAPKK